MSKPKPPERVASALRRLSDKKNEIDARRSQRPQWKTSCHLEIPGWAPLTIQAERNIQILAHAAGSVKRIRADLIDQDLPATWDGFPIVDWISDLIQRITRLRDEETLRQIEAMTAKVKPLQTEDQRREWEMDALDGQLDELLG